MNRKAWWALLIVVAGAGAAALYWTQSGSQAPDGGRAARPGGRAPVPVSIAIVARRDMPIYLTGLGSVQPTLNVSIRSQIDGKIERVLFTEGQHVKKDDILITLESRLWQAALDQARAKKAQDQAMLAAAVKDLARFKSLMAKNFETEQNVDQQQSKVDQLGAAIEADQAAIEQTQVQFDHTIIKAPSDGRVGVRMVDPGNLVHPTDVTAITTLALMQPAAVMFTLPARELDDVRSAMDRGPIEVAAFDQDNQTLLGTGTLLMIDNAIDQATSTIRLKANFPNQDERLWPGEFVNARLLLETRSSAVAVPMAAIQRGPQGVFVWVVTDKDVAQVRKVEVGPTSGNSVIITSGLNDGEGVVIDGQYKLQPNAPVTVNAPQASVP
jgi:multidrug efflux system membrane fusion protein